MCVHSYSKEEFGYLIAFKNGKIGLFTNESIAVLSNGGAYDDYLPYKLKTIRIDNDFHLRSPLIVWMEVTRTCDIACKHCFTDSGKALKDEFTTKEVFILLDELKKKNVFCLVFTGGEPLMRKDFLEILTYAHALNFIISVVTNGSFLSEELIKELPRTHLRVTLSLDGLHAKKTDFLQQRAFILEKLLLLKKYNIPCHVSATMTRGNLQELEDTISMLIEKETTFRVIPFVPIGRGALNKELQLTVKDMVQAAKLWHMESILENKLSKQMGLTFSAFFDYAFNLVYMAKACKGGRFLAYIAANGDVYPCTTCVGTTMVPAGNVRASSFDEIWEESFKEFRKLTLWENFKVCDKCAFSAPEYFCTNRCPPLAKVYNGHQFACGATPYDKASLVYRTKLLKETTKQKQETK